ncbi:hypothetical protein EBR43_07075 [bacterium]|nr:hypothetical protein [bacterium]
MNIQNEGILDPKPSDPNGYVTKDGMWAAVPFGKKFVIIHNGQQVHTANNYSTAKSYILKEMKASKRKTTTVEQFFG